MTCFPSRHMTPAEFGLWTYASRVSHETRVFYLDCRKTASAFADVSKDSIYRLAASLERKGWFVPLNEPERTQGGMYSAKRYRPLSHDEWTDLHRGACITDETGACITDATGACIKIDDHLSQNSPSPVSPVRRTSLKETSLKETSVKETFVIAPVAPVRPALNGEFAKLAFVKNLIFTLHFDNGHGTVEWGSSEARQLSRLLIANPDWNEEHLDRLIRNRFASEGVKRERPSRWIRTLGKYAGGPLNRCGTVMDSYDRTRVGMEAYSRAKNP